MEEEVKFRNEQWEGVVRRDSIVWIRESKEALTICTGQLSLL